MRRSLWVLSFVLSLVLSGFVNAQLQDVITLKKIEVYGQQYTSNVTLYKNAPVTMKVSYSVLKQTPSFTKIASSVYFVADMATGSPLQIHVHSGPGFPVSAGEKQDYEFYTVVQNASMLIKSFNSGNLYLRLFSASDGVLAYSGKFNTTFSDPTVLNNTISISGNANYKESGPTIIGSTPSVMPSGGNFKYYWQKREPSANPNFASSWQKINVNAQHYTPTAAMNQTRYFMRRAVETDQFGTYFSNEVEVKVNIGNNLLELRRDGFNSSLYIKGQKGEGGNGAALMTYKWQEKSNSTWTTVTAPSGDDFMFPIPSTATPKYYRRLISSPGLPDSVSNEIEILPGIHNNTIIKTQNPMLGVFYEGDKLLPGQIPMEGRLTTGETFYTTEKPLTYQWQKKEQNTAWEDIVGANGRYYDINVPVYEGTEFRVKCSTPNLGDSYSNAIGFVISHFPAVENNTIQFDPGNVENILGSIPTGGDGNYEYYWVVDIHPEESIGALPTLIHTQNTTIEEQASRYPLTHDEYYFTRYVISDGVWKASNTLKYSYTNGVLLKQALLSQNLKMSANEVEKKILVTENKGEVLFNFKNYNKENVQIYLAGMNGMKAEKIVTTSINSDNFISNWQIPYYYLPGVYIYKMIFNNGEIKSGKIILKK